MSWCVNKINDLQQGASHDGSTKGGVNKLSIFRKRCLPVLYDPYSEATSKSAQTPSALSSFPAYLLCVRFSLFFGG